MLKLSFLGLIFIVLLITVLYFTCSKGKEDIESEEENYILSKENIKNMWEIKYSKKMKDWKSVPVLAENLATILVFIQNVFHDFFGVDISNEKVKSIYFEAFSELKNICSNKSYRLEFAIKKEDVIWYFGFYFLVSEGDVEVHCAMKNEKKEVDWFNKILKDDRFKFFNPKLDGCTIAYTYSEMPPKGVKELEKFLEDNYLTYEIYGDEKLASY